MDARHQRRDGTFAGRGRVAPQTLGLMPDRQTVVSLSRESPERTGAALGSACIIRTARADEVFETRRSLG